MHEHKSGLVSPSVCSYNCQASLKITLSLQSAFRQVASAVFIQPPLATVGMTEEEARERISGDIDVYVSKFRAMKNTITGGTIKTLIKMLVEVSTDKV